MESGVIAPSVIGREYTLQQLHEELKLTPLALVAAALDGRRFDPTFIPPAVIRLYDIEVLAAKPWCRPADGDPGKVWGENPRRD